MDEDIQRGTLVLVFERPCGDEEKDSVGIVQRPTLDPGTWVVLVDGDERTIHLREMMALCLVKEELMRTPLEALRQNVVPAFLNLGKRLHRLESSILSAT